MADKGTFELADLLPSLPTSSPHLLVSELWRSVFELSISLPIELPRFVHHFNLHNLGKGVSGALRLTRHKVWWLSPSIDHFLPSEVDTQILILKLRRDQLEGVAVILPVTTDEYMGNLRGSGEDIIVCLESDLFRKQPDRLPGKVIVSFASDVREAIKGAVQGARASMGLDVYSDEKVSEKHLFSDSLTYCTWNSLQPPAFPTQTFVFRTISGFAACSPPILPKSLLLDDAWQDIDPTTQRLLSFESWPTFLDGMLDLGEVVKKAKDYFGVVQVGVWHTIGGYWHGVEPMPFAKKYDLIKITKDDYPGPNEPKGYSYYIPHPSIAERFFYDYYTALAKHGVSFTKCDNMASLDTINYANEVAFTFEENGTYTESIGAAINVATIRPAFKQAIQAAAKAAFGSNECGRLIWCMGMSPRVLMGQGIGMRSAAERCVVRNSDDYFPHEPDSHRHHIFTNVVNATFTSQLNIVPDFDMFQSHPSSDFKTVRRQRAQASYHAALRAFGAGPVTITDVYNQTDSGVLSKLLGYPLRSNSGAKTLVLQADHSPWITFDIFDDNVLGSGDGKALRIFSAAPKRSDGVAGMIGFWNVRSGDGRVADQILISDIIQIAGKSTVGVPLLLRGHVSGQSHIIQINAGLAPSTNELPVIPIVLEPFGFEIITVTEIHNGVGFLGLVDKYNSLAGLASFGVREMSVTSTYLCCGKAAFFIPKSARQYVEHSLNSKAAGFMFEALPQATGGLILFIELDENRDTLTIDFDIQ